MVRLDKGRAPVKREARARLRKWACLSERGGREELVSGYRAVSADRGGRPQFRTRQVLSYAAQGEGMAKTSVGVIFGGRSVEHEISIDSAGFILKHLDPARYQARAIAIDKAGRWRLGEAGAPPEAALTGPEVLPSPAPGARALHFAKNAEQAAAFDVMFPIAHGRGGEDGALQGLLELAEIPYVGSGVLGSALQMDKDITKRLLTAANLPVMPWLCFRSCEIERDASACAARALGNFSLPLFVKPANSGSSVGMSMVKEEAGLKDALQHAAQYDMKVLVEKALDAREIECAVLGDDEQVEASLPGEIIPGGEWYDYAAKYIDTDTVLKTPAELDEAATREVQALARRAFRALEGSGMARVDFFIERGSGEITLNEVNSLPGFTEISLYPRLWRVSGLEYAELLHRLVQLALTRAQRRERLAHSFQRTR